MAIQWTEDLATGFDEIDTQHKEIFERINRLLESCNRGRGKNEVGDVIRFLEDYAVMHFGTEEKYMTKYDYPEYASHKAQHVEFVINFSRLKRQFEQDGPGVHVVVSVNHMVVEWLKNHIRKVDTALGTFLKTKI